MSTRRVALNSVVTIEGGGTPSKARPEFFTGSTPWVTPKDMKCWEIHAAEDYITEEAIRESSTRLIPAGAVLVVIRSGVLKHSLPIAINRVAVTLNQDMKALRCGSQLHPEYLARALQAFAPRLLQTVRGTTADNISTDVLRRLEIPLPPLAEQRRIAEVLDKADAIRAKRRMVTARLDGLLQAVFLYMFGDPVANPKGWPKEALSGLSRVQGGLTVNRKRAEHGLNVPYLRVANVQRGALAVSAMKRIGLTPEELARTRLEEGDVLLVEGNGNPDEIGRAAIWDGSIEPCVHQNHLIRVRPHVDVLAPEYLLAFVNSDACKRYFQQVGKTTSGLVTININVVRNCPIVLPPIDAQRAYGRVQRRLKALHGRGSDSGQKLDELFASLQQRAFSGSLFTTGRRSTLTGANCDDLQLPLPIPSMADAR
jgi:type I restriction enzyme, S subunit